jgi:predicted permease
MILVALAVLLSTAAGLGCQRRFAWAPTVARQALNAMLYGLVPFVAFVNIAHLHITTAVGAGLGLAYVSLAAMGVLAWAIGTRALHLARPSVGALVCVVLLANTGYLGLPLVVALLGTARLAAAVAYDQLVSGPMLLTVGFAVGAAFGNRSGRGARERARAFLVRNPPLLAVLTALVVPPAAAPQALVDVSHVVVVALLPLGFFAVGVNLAAEARAGGSPLPAPDRAVVTAVGLRMAGTPLVLLGLSSVVLAVPQPYLLQAAMPSAINALVVAHAYGLDIRLTAAAVGWSTAVAVLAGLAISLA